MTDAGAIGGPLRVMIVDDHAIVRAGLTALLESRPDLKVIGEAENGQEAIALFEALQPDITLMDLQMPVMGGLQAMHEIRLLCPSAKIIVLTTYSGDIQATNALKGGAMGYLLKTALRTELVSAICAAQNGEVYVSPEIAHDISIHAGNEPLTPKETVILKQLSAGASNKVVARNLSITEQTVKWHLKSIFAKLGASDRTDAVLRAGRRGAFDL